MEAGYGAIAEAANAVFIFIGVIILASLLILTVGIVLSIIGYVKQNKRLSFTGISITVMGAMPMVIIVSKLILNALVYYL